MRGYFGGKFTIFAAKDGHSDTNVTATTNEPNVAILDYQFGCKLVLEKVYL